MDVVLSKPGYGTFVEAACCGLPVLYLQRPDWPEAECLEAWLHANTRAAVIPAETGVNGRLGDAIDAITSFPTPPKPDADGISAALRLINAQLDTGATIAS